MPVKSRQKMPSQYPALRHTVARQMADYQERVAERIRTEASKRGESPVDLAVALGTHPSTTERWFRGERTPQRRYRKDLSARWKLAPDFFEPDLEAEEREVRDQLNRIETKLDEVLAWVNHQKELETAHEVSEAAGADDVEMLPPGEVTGS